MPLAQTPGRPGDRQSQALTSASRETCQPEKREPDGVFR